MKQRTILLNIDHNIKNIFRLPEPNYTNKSNLLGKSSSLILHGGSVSTIIWSDDSQNLKIRVRTIDTVMKFNTFIQKACA